jgi:hypothetical protein
VKTSARSADNATIERARSTHNRELFQGLKPAHLEKPFRHGGTGCGKGLELAFPRRKVQQGLKPDPFFRGFYGQAKAVPFYKT